MKLVLIIIFFFSLFMVSVSYHEYGNILFLIALCFSCFPVVMYWICGLFAFCFVCLVDRNDESQDSDHDSLIATILESQNTSKSKQSSKSHHNGDNSSQNKNSQKQNKLQKLNDTLLIVNSPSVNGIRYSDDINNKNNSDPNNKNNNNNNNNNQHIPGSLESNTLDPKNSSIPNFNNSPNTLSPHSQKMDSLRTDPFSSQSSLRGKLVKMDSIEPNVNDKEYRDLEARLGKEPGFEEQAEVVHKQRRGMQHQLKDSKKLYQQNKQKFQKEQAQQNRANMNPLDRLYDGGNVNNSNNVNMNSDKANHVRFNTDLLGSNQNSQRSESNNVFLKSSTSLQAENGSKNIIQHEQQIQHMPSSLSIMSQNTFRKVKPKSRV